MKIWIVSYDDDSGSAPEVFTQKWEAEDAAWEWCRYYWEGEFEFSDPIPELWEQAYEQLLERATAWGDAIYVSEQDVYPPKLTGRDMELAEKAKMQFPDLDFDENPQVSRGDEAGAYVSAWVWVLDHE